MRLALLALCAAALTAAPAAAQISLPGLNGSPFPAIGFPTDSEDAPDTYKHLPYRDLVDQIRIDIAADALYNFDRGEIRKSAADYMQQAANLIFEHAKGPVRIECRSDRGPPAAAQKLGERCALAIAKWLTVQERLTKVKFTTAGASVPPPVPANPRDPLAPVTVTRSSVSISFAKE